MSNIKPISASTTQFLPRPEAQAARPNRRTCLKQLALGGAALALPKLESQAKEVSQKLKLNISDLVPKQHKALIQMMLSFCLGQVWTDKELQEIKGKVDHSLQIGGIKHDLIEIANKRFANLPSEKESLIDTANSGGFDAYTIKAKCKGSAKDSYITLLDYKNIFSGRSRAEIMAKLITALDHEFRHVYRLEKGLNLDDQSKEELEVISQNVVRLRNLVSEFRSKGSGIYMQIAEELEKNIIPREESIRDKVQTRLA